MNVLFNADHNRMAEHLTRRDCEGLKKCCISGGMDGTDNDMLCNGSVEDGDVKS
jgi:hypothetical protein